MFRGDLVEITITHLCDEWTFPRDRFVEYGPSDQAWAEPLDFGRPSRVPHKIVIPGCQVENWSVNPNDDYVMVSEFEAAVMISPPVVAIRYRSDDA